MHDLNPRRLIPKRVAGPDISKLSLEVSKLFNYKTLCICFLPGNENDNNPGSLKPMTVMAKYYLTILRKVKEPAFISVLQLVGFKVCCAQPCRDCSHVIASNCYVCEVASLRFGKMYVCLLYDGALILIRAGCPS